MEEKTKNVEFKYVENDGSIELGVPKSIFVEKGNWRDGGCNLKFNTSELSIGLREPFSLYLFAEDVNAITREIWKAYNKTEPERAKKDIDTFIDFLKGLK